MDATIQVVVNGVVSASGYLLVALGLMMVYRVAGFLHFAHGVLVTAGAYFAFVTIRCLGAPLAIAVPVGIILATLLGCLMETLVYRPLRRKNASGLVLLLASLGFYTVLQNIVSLLFGDDTKVLRRGTVEEGLSLLGARITLSQVNMIWASLVLMAAVTLLLRKTKLGKAIRAVADDAELARVSGIDSSRTILWTFAIASALAGVAGILIAFDVDMTPTMGMHVLMMGIVAVIIGGIGSVPGVALGALLLGMAQQVAVWKISSQWQDAIAFVILLGFLLFRPEGFMGKRVRKATT